MPARQQTLRETLDWSYDLMSEHERRALTRLSVVRGGCFTWRRVGVAALAAAEAWRSGPRVCSVPPMRCWRR